MFGVQKRRVEIRKYMRATRRQHVRPVVFRERRNDGFTMRRARFDDRFKRAKLLQ